MTAASPTVKRTSVREPARIAARSRAGVPRDRLRALSCEDVQGQADHRRIAIRKVGVKNISYPITVLDRARRLQRTVATVNMYVNLPHHFKGTHMSRFVEILNRFHGEINLASMHRILLEMKERLQAQAAHLEIDFPYFLKAGGEQEDSAAPVEGVGVNRYQCRMHGALTDQDQLSLAIKIPIAPPRPAPGCPGLPRSLGHWGTADISLRFRRFVWLEEIIELVVRVTSHDLCWPAGSGEAAAGGGSAQGGEPCDLSVENLARTLGAELARHPDIESFSVRVENLAAGYNTFAILTS